MADPHHHAEKLRDLDAFHAQVMILRTKRERDGGEAGNSSASVNLGERVMALYEEGNWAQALKWLQTGETVYAILQTVELFDVNLEFMEDARTSLDQLHEYKIAKMPEHVNFGHENEDENKRLDFERMEFQNNMLANIRELLSIPGKDVLAAVRATMVTSGKAVAKKEAAEVEEGAKTEHGNEEQTIDKTTMKAHQATAEDLDESEEELAVASQAQDAAVQTQETGSSARRADEITEQMKRLCEDFVPLQNKIQAAHDQRQQEAMQQDMEALKVHEASIAAQKKELQAKMRK